MKQLQHWCTAFFKRILCLKKMWLLFLIFPLLCGAISAYTNTTTPVIRIALFQEDDSPLATETIRQLTNSEGVISFYEVTSADQLYRDVENTSAECGYIFTKNYQKESLLTENAWKKSVQAIQSPASTLTGTVNELVFSVFFKHYNLELLHERLSDKTIFENEEDAEAAVKDIDALFEQHCTDGGTFSFGKTNPAAEAESQGSGSDLFLSNACRGILSVLLLLCAMCGGFYLEKDKKTLFVMPMRPAVRLSAQLLDILVPVLAMALSSVIGIVLLPSHQNLLLEIPALVLYCINLTMFVFLLNTYMCSSFSFSALIPFITLCTLVLAPVFIDASAYIRLLGIPKYLLPATYYLEAVTSTAAFIRLVAATAILTAGGYISSRLSEPKYRA